MQEARLSGRADEPPAAVAAANKRPAGQPNRVRGAAREPDGAAAEEPCERQRERRADRRRVEQVQPRQAAGPLADVERVEAQSGEPRRRGGPLHRVEEAQGRTDAEDRRRVGRERQRGARRAARTSPCCGRSRGSARPRCRRAPRARGSPAPRCTVRAARSCARPRCCALRKLSSAAASSRLATATARVASDGENVFKPGLRCGNVPRPEP